MAGEPAPLVDDRVRAMLVEHRDDLTETLGRVSGRTDRGGITLTLADMAPGADLPAPP